MTTTDIEIKAWREYLNVVETELSLLEHQVRKAGDPDNKIRLRFRKDAVTAARDVLAKRLTKMMLGQDKRSVGIDDE